MQRKSVIVIISICLLSFLIVAILYAISDEPFSYHQDFTRLHRHDVVQQRSVLDLKDHSYYIAGATTSQFFFGSEMDSLDLIITDTLLENPQHLSLKVADDENLKLKGSRIEIDSPFFYIKNGYLPGIFRGTMNSWRATRILDSITYFYHAMPITKNSFAYQARGNEEGSSTKQNILCKISGNQQVDFNPKLLKGEFDSYFSTSGQLRYSKKMNQLIYTYFYQNQFLVIDTSLNMQYSVNTLGTGSQDHIKSLEVDKGYHALSSTPAIINRGAQICEDLLFIDSNLKALNEDKATFRQVSIIDVYDIRTGKYSFSFHLPYYNDVKMTSFKITRNFILALYGQHAVTYVFQKPIFSTAIVSGLDKDITDQ